MNVPPPNPLTIFAKGTVVSFLFEWFLVIDEVIYCDQFQKKMLHLHEEDKQLNRLKNLLRIEKDQMNTNKENK